MTTPITPDERSRWRALADAATEGPWGATLYGSGGELAEGVAVTNHDGGYTDFGTEICDAKFIAAARTAVPRLLDALDTAEAEITRLREDITPEALEQALRDAGIVQVVDVHEGYGPEEVVHAHLDSVVDAVIDLCPGESRATVQAEALQAAADEWGADPDAVGDSPADYRNWLRERAQELRAR